MTITIQRIALAGTITIILGVLLPAKASSQTLVIGNEGTYPPFSIITADGHLTGFEPELARAMCERMKPRTECKIEPNDMKALLPMLVSNKIDLIASAMWPTPERLEKSEFTKPIYYNPNAFVVARGWSKGQTPADFDGVRVGVIAGSAQEAYLKREMPHAQVVPYNNPELIRLDLEAGRIAAAFGGKITWDVILSKSAGGRAWKTIEHDEKGKSAGVSWAAHKGNLELVQKVNAAISSLLEDCTYTKIRKRFLPAPTTPDEPKTCL